MKKPGNKFWEVVALSVAFLIIIFTCSAIWFKYQLTSEQLSFFIHFLRQFIGPIIIITSILLVVCGWTTDAIFRKYVRPVGKIADEVAIQTVKTNGPPVALTGRMDDQVIARPRDVESIAEFAQ